MSTALRRAGAWLAGEASRTHQHRRLIRTELARGADRRRWRAIAADKGGQPRRPLRPLRERGGGGGGGGGGKSRSGDRPIVCWGEGIPGGGRAGDSGCSDGRGRGVGIGIRGMLQVAGHHVSELSADAARRDEPLHPTCVGVASRPRDEERDGCTRHCNRCAGLGQRRAEEANRARLHRRRRSTEPARRAGIQPSEVEWVGRVARTV